MGLTIFPATLKQANEMVATLHRHHKPAQGHRFSIGVRDAEGVIHGAAIIGRPVGRKSPQYDWAEVTRLVTDGTHNACSKLYGAAARICKEMGFTRIQTFTLESEGGVSLKASGWTFDGYSDGADGWDSRDGRRADQPRERKQRWKRDLQ